MRRIIVALASALAFLCLTLPSHGWWGLHHHPHHAYAPMAPLAAPAMPTTFGVTLPGGIGLQLTPDGSILQQLQGVLSQHRPGQQAPPGPTTRVTVDSDILGTIDRVEKNATAAADKLDSLIGLIKKGDPTGAQDLQPVERAKKQETILGPAGTPMGSGTVKDNTPVK
jgi:hypothetical protein